MTALTPKISFSGNREGGTKFVELETASTANHADTVAVTLADFGASAIKWIRAYRHTTDNSVVVDDDAPTTSVSNGVLTITIGGSTDGKKRFFTLGLA